MTDNDRETNTSLSLFGVFPDGTHSAPNAQRHARLEKNCCSDDVMTVWCASTDISDTLMACGWHVVGIDGMCIDDQVLC